MVAGNNVVQTVASNLPVVFTDILVPCNRGLVRFREGTGNFTLSGWTPWEDMAYSCGCMCEAGNSALYDVNVKANIAIPTGGTAGEISLSLSLDGTVVPLSEMVITPAAVEQYFNVSVDMPIDIWNGCCQSLSLINTSTQDILVRTPLIAITRPDLDVTY